MPHPRPVSRPARALVVLIAAWLPACGLLAYDPTGTSTTTADAGNEPLPCVGESDETFCARLDRECNVVSALDNCERARSVNCGACVPGTVCGGGGTANRCGCNATSCGELAWCNTSTGRCEPGCRNAGDCDATTERCETSTHACVCASGFHECGDACVSNGAVTSCGASCDPCIPPENADATCDGSSCGFQCHDDFLLCNEACARCPAAASAVTCDGTRCKPTACAGDFVPCAEGCCRWVRTTVDTGDRGSHNSIVLDSTGHPHISYYDVAERDLRYARWTGAEWILKAALGTGDAGTFSSIALDPQERPRIACWGAEGVLTVHWSGTSWSVRTVENLSGAFASFAIDSAGRDHVVYYDIAGHRLRYAHWDGSTYRLEEPDPAGDEGAQPSLVLDTQDRPHIAHIELTPGGATAIRYAGWTGTSWNRSTLVTGQVYKPSIKIDANGRPAIAYKDKDVQGGGRLRYAWNDGAQWHFETVDAAGNVGSQPSLVFDSSGTPHISYNDDETIDVKYAVKRGGTWIVEAIDVVGQFSEATIAVDTAGVPHVAYFDMDHGALRYARREVSR